MTAMKEGMLIMSKKERDRKVNFEAVLKKQMTLKECAKILTISYSQTKRSFKRYKEQGDKSLCHAARGRTPANAYSEGFKDQVLQLYRSKYLGFGPVFASEKLEEDDGIKLSDETLRRWVLEAKLWTRIRKHVAYRERRERRPQFGDLLQIDGSIHSWFSDGQNDCLLNMIDDATGITFALLDTGETTQILLTCLKKWIEKYGIPKAVYVDLKSVYIGLKKLKDPDDDSIYQGNSVFEQVCRRLNVTVIKAYSPQAKGRVERSHQIFQDRFLKDLSLYKINTIEKANKYLEEKFLPSINKKFAKKPSNPIDGHRDVRSLGNLNQLICWEETRKLRNDYTVLFKGQYFQMKPTAFQKKTLKPKDRITIKKHLDGSVTCWFKNKPVKAAALQRKPTQTPMSDHEKKPIIRTQKPPVPTLNHPWRNTPPGYLSPRKYLEAKQKLNEIQQLIRNTTAVNNSLNKV